MVWKTVRAFTSTAKCFATSHRCLSSDPRQKTMLLDLNAIPNIEKYWPHFISLEEAEEKCKENLLNELITESRLNTTTMPLQDYQKESLIRLDVDTLRQQCFITSVNTITDGLLSCLETFPYDDRDSVLVRAKSLNRLSIKVIRDVIERQYLTWKWDCPQEEVRNIFWRYRASFYPYRSLTNTRKNLKLLDSVPELQNRSIPEKIYLLNQKPFDLESIRKFNGEIAGLSWHVFRHHCPKTLAHSYQYIVFVVSFLKDLGFTETQIQNGLHYLYLKFRYFLRRLNSILEHSELCNFKNDDHFLELLFLTQRAVKELMDERGMSYKELLEIPKIHKPKRAVRMQFVNVSSILYLVSQFYPVSNECASMIKRHSKYRYITERQIHDTLQFLTENDFTAEEVEESICIIFYPRELIKKAMEEIKKEDKILAKLGFVDGCVAEKTEFFKKGTKGKRKTLQLCLYYLEKPQHFSGDGVWTGGEIKKYP